GQPAFVRGNMVKREARQRGKAGRCGVERGLSKNRGREFVDAVPAQVFAVITLAGVNGAEELPVGEGDDRAGVAARGIGRGGVAALGVYGVGGQGAAEKIFGVKDRERAVSAVGAGAA